MGDGRSRPAALALALTRKQPPAKSGDPLAAGSLWAIQLAHEPACWARRSSKRGDRGCRSEEGRRQRVPFHGHIEPAGVRIAPQSANLQRTRLMRRPPARRQLVAVTIEMSSTRARWSIGWCDETSLSRQDVSRLPP